MTNDEVELELLRRTREVAHRSCPVRRLIRNLVAIGPGEAELACVFTGRRSTITAASVVLVTALETRSAFLQTTLARLSR